MRNKVGQEATEEMSAFKGVVNLFIVVLLYLSRHIRAGWGGTRSGEVLVWVRTVVVRTQSLATRHALGDIKNDIKEEEKRCCLYQKFKKISGAAGCWWFSDALTHGWTFGCAPAAGREASVCHCLSMCFLWMIKEGKIRSSSSTSVWRRSGRSEILAVTQRGREKETAISFRRTRLRAERG